MWRVYLSFLGIILLSLLVLGRAFYIQRFQGNYWRSMSDSLHQKFIPLIAERGTIYSEDGQMLSTSIPSFDIYMDFNADGLREKKGRRFKENLDSFSIALANYFGDKTAAQYKRELLIAYTDNERHYLLKKKLSFEDYKVFRDFPLVKLGRNKSGVMVDVISQRKSPFGLLANRTIGLSRMFVDNDRKTRKQNVGLERSYDTLLSGHDGQKLVRYTAGGYIPIEGSETDPDNGKDIFTTIDVTIQDITETALMKKMLESDAPYGTAIVMETSTGKIKAMANLGRRPDGSYWEDDNYALRATEPGSTMKLTTLLSVLEKGTSSLTDLVEVGSTGSMQVGPRVVTDAERFNKPLLTVKECFAHSSNVGMSKLAYKGFGERPEEFREYLHRFYLDEKSPIDLTDVPHPTMAPLKLNQSGLGNMLSMSYGYAIQVSPLHTLTLYNAIANDGQMMKPYLVSSVQRNGIILKHFEPTVMAKNICKPAIVQAAKECMEAVITEGTGKKAFEGMPFSVAGKTGTAHVADGKLKYYDGVYQASFVGYFPADKPQYTCIVVIRTKPHAPLHFGGLVAAPVFREIATKLYAIYADKRNPSFYAAIKDSTVYFYAGYTNDIQTVYKTLHLGYTDSVAQHTWSSVYASNYQPVLKGNTIRQQVMPNVRGMGLKDALYLLENMGMKVAVKGKGKIVVQSVAPGTVLIKGVTIMLELS